MIDQKIRPPINSEDKTNKNFDSTSSINSDIISFQTKPFFFTINTLRGREVIKIHVRNVGYSKKPWLSKCFDCGLVFKYENEFQCKKHRRQAGQVRIQVCGVNNSELKDQVLIYTDLDGNLLSLNNVYSLKKSMEDDIKENNFNIWRYLPRKKKKFLFSNYAPTYLDDIKRRSELNHEDEEWCSIAHYKDVNYAFQNHIMPFFKNYDIVKIYTGLITDFRNSPTCAKPKKSKQKRCGKTLTNGKCSCGWKEDKKNKGIAKSKHQKKKYIGYLMSMFYWAEERCDIAKVPKIKKIKFKGMKKSGLPYNVQQTIFEKIPEKHKLIFRWIREEGRRPGEAPALKVRDIEFNKPYYYKGELLGCGIYCYTGSFDRNNYKPFPKVKDMAGDECPLSDEGKAILKTALKDRICNPNDFVFINPNTRRVYTYDKIRKIFAKAREDAKYPEVELNTWGRHSKAQYYAELGLSGDEIAHRLGDKNGATINNNYVTQTAGLKAGKEKSVKEKRTAKVIPFRQQ